MEHGPFVDDLPIQHGDLHSYVKLPDSTGNDPACRSIATTIGLLGRQTVN